MKKNDTHWLRSFRFFKTSIGLTCILWLCASAAFAQTPAGVKGKVSDETGMGMPGVSVKVKNTSTVSITDGEGNYSLQADNIGTAVLVFSYVGYTQKEESVNNRPVINIALAPSSNALSEVVVVGYGTQKRTSVTGAIDRVGSEMIEGKPAMNATLALQGVAPNVVVQQRNSEPGGAININIRGVGTLGSSNPLVVIDGIVGGDINLLNPADIESYSILKDAGSAAIYGSRSSNGVILITTKKGARNSGSKLTFNALAGVLSPQMLYKPVQGFENAILRNQANVNAGLPPIYSAQQIRDYQAAGDKEYFLDAIMQNSLQQNHNVSLTGGTDKSSFLVSAGYADQQSNFVGPDYGLKRYNFRMNMDNQYGKLKLTSILAYAKTRIKDHSSSTSTLIVDASRVPALYDLKDDQGRYLTNDALSEFNPLGILEKGGYRKHDNDNIFGSITAELAVTDFLKLRGVFGGTLDANHQFDRTMRVDYFPSGVSGADQNTNDINNKNLFINTQFIAEFNKTFNDVHAITALVGVSNESTDNKRNALFRRLTDPELGTPISGSETNEDETRNSNQGTSETSLNSMFGRATYAYQDKYYGEFNFRVDGSSKFNRKNRWGFFPSFSAGYRISQEDFMENYRDKYGDLKVRASYGILGNQNVGNYQFQTTYFNFPNAYGFDNEAVAGAGFNFANPDIRWERAATFNVGVDAGFLKNALTVSVDYFDKITRDILVAPRVPGVFGTGLPDFNSAEVQNRGWEASVSYRFSGTNFKHMVSANIGDSKNKVLDFQGIERIQSSDEMQYITRVGLPFNSYVGLKTDGFFQNLDEVNAGPKPDGITVLPGDIRYIDVNKDGVINDRDRFVLGNPFPRYTFGLTYNLGWKNFDMNVFIQGVGKRNSFIRGELVEPFHFNYGQVMYQHQLDFWTPTNPDARYPRLASNGSQSNANNFRRGSDAYIYDASYARLKNVQIGYSLPADLTKKLGMQKLRVYASGQNLFTLSKMDFLDPEVTEFDNSMKTGGANSGRAYPTPLYVGFGLDVIF